MEFEITAKAKKKAIQRRKRTEKKWIPMRIASVLCIAGIIYSVIKIVHWSKNIPTVDGYGLAPTPEMDMYTNIVIALVIGLIMLRAFLEGFCGNWIRTRMSERLWVEDDCLYHMIIGSHGTGANQFVESSGADIFKARLEDIRHIRHDPASNRVEFDLYGERVRYSDWRREKVERTRTLNGYTHRVYDYYTPSLVEYFKEQGMKVTEETIDFKIADGTI